MHYNLHQDTSGQPCSHTGRHIVSWCRRYDVLALATGTFIGALVARALERWSVRRSYCAGAFVSELLRVAAGALLLLLLLLEHCCCCCCWSIAVVAAAGALLLLLLLENCCCCYCWSITVVAAAASVLLLLLLEYCCCCCCWSIAVVAAAVALLLLLLLLLRLSCCVGAVASELLACKRRPCVGHWFGLSSESGSSPLRTTGEAMDMTLR